MVLSKLPLPLNQFDRFLLHLLIVRIISFNGLKGISFSHLVNFVLAYFSMKCCSMQVNNAGIGGVVIKTVFNQYSNPESWGKTLLVL